MPAVRRTRLIEALWKLHRWTYRRSGGLIGGRILGMRVLLLTTRGRRSGVPRTTALNYLPVENGYLIIASNAGEPTHPAWFLNLQATSQAEVQVGRRRFPVTASVITGEQKRHLWSLVIGADPGYAEYQRRTSRDIPLVLLRPVVVS